MNAQYQSITRSIFTRILENQLQTLKICDLDKINLDATDKQMFLLYSYITYIIVIPALS